MGKQIKSKQRSYSFWEWINLKLEPWLTNPVNRERNVNQRLYEQKFLQITDESLQ